MAGRYLAALHAWHQDLMDSGRSEHSLPTARDLQVIAEFPDLERSMLPRLGLDRPEAVASYFAGIKGVLRSVSVDLRQTPEPASPEPEPARAAEAAPGTSNRRSRLREGGTASAPRAATGSAAEAAPSRTGRPSPTPTNEAPLSAASFAPLDLEAPPTESLGLTPLNISVRADEALLLSWAAPAGPGFRVYRVITSDEWMPYSPESGFLLAAGTTTEAVDQRPFTGPTRRIQIWMNSGQDRARALAAQPQLLAQGMAVSPVTGVELRVSQGIVTGSWSVHDAIQRVEVQRVPARDAARPGYVARHRLTSVRGRATSLRDTTCVPGERYQYRFFAVVTTEEGTEVLSEPVVRDIEVPAPALPVQDLEPRRYVADGRTLVDLRWTPPSDRSDVSIYVTTERPGAAFGEEMEVGALRQANLEPENREFMQPEIVDGRAFLEGIPWPEGSPRMYLTAVTVQGPRACVGHTVGLVDVGSIHEFELVQRVTWQLLTFDWPVGAAVVQVYSSAVGMPRPQGGPPLAQIDKETYDDRGGLRLPLVRLGEFIKCDLHLLPISYSEGQVIEGPSTRVHYPGMLRLLYSVVEQQAPPSGRWNRAAPPSRWFIHLQSDQRQPPPMTLALVLVRHDRRLPLDEGDGIVIMRQRVAVPGMSPVPVAEFDRSRPGYYRLFVERDSSVPFHIALLDPPLHLLLKTS